MWAKYSDFTIKGPIDKVHTTPNFTAIVVNVI